MARIIRDKDIFVDANVGYKRPLRKCMPGLTQGCACLSNTSFLNPVFIIPISQIGVWLSKLQTSWVNRHKFWLTQDTTHRVPMLSTLSPICWMKESWAGFILTVVSM